MKRQAFQHPELRDANDNIIQEGTYGKASPLVNGDNTGVLDYINNNLEALYDAQTAIAGTYLPLNGGTMTGSIRYVDNEKAFTIGKTNAGNVDLCWGWATREGAGLALRSTDYSSPGEFMLFARDANNASSLTGTPGGSLTWNSQPLLPVGIVQAFAGTTIPSGWLLCDGSAVSRTTYANLYACIGDTYGAGNGSTTFNLPNLTDKFIQGSRTVGTVKAAGLPNITGVVWINGGRNSTTNGAIIYTAQQGGGGTENSNTGTGSFNFDASRSSSVYGKSTTVQPPALTMRYIIKY